MELRLLGSQVVRVDDEERPLPAGRPTRLLTALALQPGQIVDRDALVTAIWEDRPPASLRNALHVYVSRLRSLLGTSAIVTSGSGYCLTIAAEAIDIMRFQRLIDEATTALAIGSDAMAATLLQDAVNLHTGPLLPGESLGSTLTAARVRFTALYEQARDTLLAIRLRNATKNDADELLRMAQALVEEAPLRENRHALLIEALHLSGRTTEALLAYDTVVSHLRADTGVGPSEQLQELRRRIVGDSMLAEASTVTSASDPVIGRDQQVETLVALVRERRLVTVTGPGGIGKSRVATRAVDQLRAVFGDRIVHVDLADVEPGADICALVTAAVEAETGMRITTFDDVDDSPALLVLDTCDRHDVTVITDLVSDNCPQLHMLTTGRRPVGTVGEAVLRVGPLEVGDEETAEQDLRHLSAVRLYLTRAADAGHTITSALVPQVARLVRELDGCPLAISLATAHPDGGRPDVLLTRPLGEIVGPSNRPSAVPRHQSEAHSLQWTLDLLSHDAISVLRAACELPSGAPDSLLVAAADAVDPIAGLDELLWWSVLLRPTLPQLAAVVPNTVRSSVVKQTSEQERTAIRARARAALGHIADSLLDRPLSVPRTSDDSDLVFRLTDSALLAHSWPEPWPSPEARALSLLLLVDAPLSRSHQTEYGQWIASTLDQPLSADLRYDLQRVRVGVALACSDPVQVADATRDMAGLLTEVDDHRRAAWAVDSVFLALEDGRFGDAVDLAVDAAAEVERAGRTDGPLGVRAGRARMHATHLHLGLDAGMTEALQTAALADLVDSTESISAFGEAAEILVNAGELDLGSRFTKRAARLALRWNSPHSLVHVLSLADIAFEQGRLDESRAIVHALLDRVWRRGNDRYMKWCLIRLSQIAERSDDPKKAATLLGASSSISLTVGWDADPDVCALLETLPAALGGEAFRYAFERGSAAPRGWVAATLEELIPLPDTLHPDVVALLRQSSPMG